MAASRNKTRVNGDKTSVKIEEAEPMTEMDELAEKEKEKESDLEAESQSKNYKPERETATTHHLRSTRDSEKVPIEVPKDGSLFNVPHLVPSRGDRGYAGPTSTLMNELYDSIRTPNFAVAIQELAGWNRISGMISRACIELEKAGWRKGKK